MWTAVLLAGSASYLLRVLPLFLLSRVELPERLSEALQHAAMGAMGVLLVTAAARAAAVGEVAGPGGGGTVLVVGRALGVVVGLGLGLVMARRGRSMLAVLLATLSVYAGVTWVATALAARAG